MTSSTGHRVPSQLELEVSTLWGFWSRCYCFTFRLCLWCSVGWEWVETWTQMSSLLQKQLSTLWWILWGVVQITWWMHSVLSMVCSPFGRNVPTLFICSVYLPSSFCFQFLSLSFLNALSILLLVISQSFPAVVPYLSLGKYMIK